MAWKGHDPPAGTWGGSPTNGADGENNALVVRLHSQQEGKMEQSMQQV